MAKILCVLYDDPIGGYPKSHARDDIPKIDRYPGGQSADKHNFSIYLLATRLGPLWAALRAHVGRP